MALTPQQLEILNIISAVDTSGVFALAGGGAINALGVADRPTRDLDLFTPALDKLASVVDLVTAELERRSIPATVGRRDPGFVRLTVGAGEPTVVEFAHDYRWLDPVQTNVGLVLDIRELAADKMCALFGRAEVRDVLDVAALARRFTIAEMAVWARQKDPGFDLAVTHQMLMAITPQLDTTDTGFEAIRERISVELQQLIANPDSSA